MDAGAFIAPECGGQNPDDLADETPSKGKEESAMKINHIRIEPVGEGWAVKQDFADNLLVFSSGARAEDAAIALAQRLASAGQASEVSVFLRDGALAGRYACPPTT